MSIGGVVINFAAKTADAISDVARLNRTLDDTDDSAKKSRGGILGLADGMGRALPIVGAVAGAAVAAGYALVQMGKDALEDKKSADLLANTLKNIPGITDAMVAANEEWVSSMQLATLIADTDLREAVGKLALGTRDLAKAQELATLAADVAIGSGREYSAVVDAMAKAAEGKTTALQRMFPFLDAGSDKVLTLAEAEAQLGTSFAGAAAEAAKNDPWKAMGVIWDELKESVGVGLLPVLDLLSKWFANATNRQKIQDIIDAIADLARKFGEDAVEAIEEFIKWIGSPQGQKAMRDMRDVAIAVGAAAKVAASAILDIKGALDKLPSAPPWTNWLGPFGNFIAALQSGVENLKRLWEWINRVKDAIPSGGFGGLGAFGRAAPAPAAVTPMVAPRAAVAPANITINVPATSNPTEVGREIVERIRAYERAAGRGWRTA